MKIHELLSRLTYEDPEMEVRAVTHFPYLISTQKPQGSRQQKIKGTSYQEIESFSYEDASGSVLLINLSSDYIEKKKRVTPVT